MMGSQFPNGGRGIRNGGERLVMDRETVPRNRAVLAAIKSCILGFCHHPWSRLRGGRTPVGGVGLRLGLGRSSMRVRRGLLRPNALAPPIVECREVGETLGTIVENVQGSAVRGRKAA